ncbi:14188_t:CDS:2 [Acaulospora morrowiae]|uniref:14188_t:CDS:1 n=1 Tax=Acaulospora morrowiae TaxID=94023 RepID=A0A9N9DR86_9GLOM|nr:14188_t:CDS:2 [Acaulospora morrowiae]
MRSKFKNFLAKQSDKDTASENAELKAEIAELRHGIVEIKKKDQSVTNISAFDITNNTLNPGVSLSSIDLCQDTKTQQEADESQCITSPIRTEAKSSEDTEIEFLERVHKETVSNEIRRRKHEEKLQQETVIRCLSNSTKAILSKNDQGTNLSCDVKTVPLGNDQKSNRNF